MSSDNYWIIRRTANGKFAALMGFASDEVTPKPQADSDEYGTPEQALKAVINDYAEYGHSIHEECYLSFEQWQAQEAIYGYVAKEVTGLIESGYSARDIVDYVIEHVLLNNR